MLKDRQKSCLVDKHGRGRKRRLSNSKAKIQRGMTSKMKRKRTRTIDRSMLPGFGEVGIVIGMSVREQAAK